MTGRAYLAGLLLGVSGWGCSFDRSGLPEGLDGGGDGNDTPLQVGDVRLLYVEVGTGRLRSLRLGDDDTWRRESSTSQTGDEIPAWVVTRATPGMGEEVAVVAHPSASGSSIAVYAGGAAGWRLEWSAALDQPIGGRAFDVELEASGDLIVAYGRGTGQPFYRVRSGTTWSDEQAVPVNDGAGPGQDLSTGQISWLELEPRATTDEMALGIVAGDELVVTTWDGDAWSIDCAARLEASVRQAQGDVIENRVFDLAWESVSGALVVAWGAEVMGSFYYGVLGTDGVWNPLRQHRPGNVSGAPYFVDLAPDPSSDRIAAALLDIGSSNERLGVAMWDGVQWGGVELDTQIRDVNGDALGRFAGAVGWFGAEALCVYTDDETGAMSWARWQPGVGWTLGEDTLVPAMGAVESVLLTPTEAGLWAILLDAEGSIHALRWDGAQWRPAESGALLAGMQAPIENLPFAVATKTR